MNSPEHSAPHYYRPLSISGLEGCQQCWNCGTLWHLGKYWLHDHVSTEQPPCAALQVESVPMEAWLSTASPRSSSPPRHVTNRAVGSVEARIHQLLQADTRLAGCDTAALEAMILQLLAIHLQPGSDNGVSTIALNGYQLSEALEFLAPDRCQSQLKDFLTLTLRPGCSPRAEHTDTATCSITLEPDAVYVPKVTHDFPQVATGRSTSSA
jgi:hypothetical protein